MTADQIEAERARFEVWWRIKYPYSEIERGGDGYWYGATQHACQSWLAAKQDAHDAARELPQN